MKKARRWRRGERTGRRAMNRSGGRHALATGGGGNRSRGPPRGRRGTTPRGAGRRRDEEGEGGRTRSTHPPPWSPDTRLQAETASAATVVGGSGSLSRVEAASRAARVAASHAPAGGTTPLPPRRATSSGNRIAAESQVCVARGSKERGTGRVLRQAVLGGRGRVRAQAGTHAPNPTATYGHRPRRRGRRKSLARLARCPWTTDVHTRSRADVPLTIATGLSR